MGADGHSLLGLQYRINRVCTAVKNSISVKCQSVKCQVSRQRKNGTTYRAITNHDSHSIVIKYRRHILRWKLVCRI